MLVTAKFVRERDAAMLSLDKNTIFAFMKKWDIFEYPDNEESFWAGVHKVRLASVNLPSEAREFSRQWLRLRGYTAGMGYDEPIGEVS